MKINLHTKTFPNYQGNSHIKPLRFLINGVDMSKYPQQAYNSHVKISLRRDFIISPQKTKITIQRHTAIPQVHLGQPFARITIYTLSMNNLKPRNIIFTFSMKKISNSDNMLNFEQQSQSFDKESSQSDFSFSRTKKIRRRINRKKVTKIVHTFCFLIETSEGKRQTIYYQRLGETSIKDLEGVKLLAQRQLRQNKGRMMELAKEKAELPLRKNTEKTVNNELVKVPPLVHFFNPNQYYFLM